MEEYGFVALVLIVIAVLVYLYLCLVVLGFVALPLSAYTSSIGLLLGVTAAMVLAVAVLAGRGPANPPYPPAAFAARRARRSRFAYVRPDPAWPHYFVVQIVRDIWTTVRWGLRVTADIWARSARPLRGQHQKKILFFWPMLLPAAAGLAGFTAGLAAGMLAVFTVCAVVDGVAWLLGLGTVAALRGADRAWQFAFRASASCPHCYYVTRLPAYRCAGPHPAGDNLHRDIRPGVLGVLWRRCACHRRLPTTVLRASRTLEPICQRCGQPLHPGAAVATDVRIPVFGATSAGKTHLIMAGLVTLVRRSGENGRLVDLADEESRREYAEFERVVDGDGSPAKTRADRKPVAITVSMRVARRNALVHVFDAAGEALVDAEQSAEYAYLDYARTLIFVLDPFSVADVRSQMRSLPDLLRQANPATHDPEDSYHSTITRLRRYGVATEQQRLAFVLTKADLLALLPSDDGAAPSTSGAVREWLCERRLDNLVIAAERDFRTVEFFLSSAKDLTLSGVAAPFLWLLRTDRVELSPQGGKHVP